jgi:hypothetical protein
MRTLKELHIRRMELERLSDYHRQLLLDSIEENTASLRLVEGVAFLAANPAVLKLIGSRAVAGAMPVLLQKFWPALSGLWDTAGGALRVVSAFARLISGLVGFVLLLLRCAGGLLDFLLRNRARSGSGVSRGKAKV